MEVDSLTQNFGREKTHLSGLDYFHEVHKVAMYPQSHNNGCLSIPTSKHRLLMEFDDAKPAMIFMGNGR